MSIVACLKWVSHPGEPDDERFAGMSAADQSALEFALRQGEATGLPVVAVTVGPAGAADRSRRRPERDGSPAFGSEPLHHFSDVGRPRAKRPPRGFRAMCETQPRQPTWRVCW